MNDQGPIDTETAEVVDEPRGKLAAAVAAVMKEVKRLEKADNNAFAKYKFTSVDDYKDALRPLMAEQGLSVGLSQVGHLTFEAKKYKGEKVEAITLTCQYDFELWLEHESGEIGQREGSTICLPYTGAQTTGQARSYAQKEWLKSKFLASSGDLAEDADAYALDIKLPKAEARNIYERLVGELRELGKFGADEDMKDWINKNSIFLDAMPNDWMMELRNEGAQANLMIKERKASGPQVPMPSNIENWLSDLESSLEAQTSIDDLNSAWSEAQPVASALPSEESRRAFAILEKSKQRFED